MIPARPRRPSSICFSPIMPTPNTNPFGAGELFANASRRHIFDADFRSACRQRRERRQASAASPPDAGPDSSSSHGLQLFAAVVGQGAKQLAAAATIDRSRLSNVAGHVTFVDEYCECLLCEHGPMPVGDPLGFDEGWLRPFRDNDEAEPDLGKQTF